MLNHSGDQVERLRVPEIGVRSLYPTAAGEEARGVDVGYVPSEITFAIQRRQIFLLRQMLQLMVQLRRGPLGGGYPRSKLEAEFVVGRSNLLYAEFADFRQVFNMRAAAGICVDSLAYFNDANTPAQGE